jgi:hypothetical protein
MAEFSSSVDPNDDQTTTFDEPVTTDPGPSTRSENLTRTLRPSPGGAGSFSVAVLVRKRRTQAGRV